MSQSPLRCRSCGTPEPAPILSLGRPPLADVLLTEEELGQTDLRFPLDLLFCPHCALVQIAETVPLDAALSRRLPVLHLRLGFPPGALRSERGADHRIEATRAAVAGGGGRQQRRLHAAEVRGARDPGARGSIRLAGPRRRRRGPGCRRSASSSTEALAERLRAEGKLADVVIGNNVLNLVDRPGRFHLGRSNADEGRRSRRLRGALPGRSRGQVCVRQRLPPERLLLLAGRTRPTVSGAWPLRERRRADSHTGGLPSPLRGAAGATASDGRGGCSTRRLRPGCRRSSTTGTSPAAWRR